MDKPLSFFSHDLPLNNNLHRLADNCGWDYVGVYFMILESMYMHMMPDIELSVLKQDIDTDDGRTIDAIVYKLSSRGLISLSGTVVSCESVRIGIDRVKSKRVSDVDRQSKCRNNQLKQSEETTTVTSDYKALVQAWDKAYTMSDVQKRTSYSRLKISSSWASDSVTRAMEFIGSHPTIVNTVMCDWYEAGFFVPGYEFDLCKINDHFTKNKNKNKKSSSSLPGGGFVAGVDYEAQGHPHIKIDPIKTFGSTKIVEEKIDPELESMMDV